MSLATGTLTYEDLRALPEDGNRYELIAGELIVSPSPGELHQRVSFDLTLLLGTHVKTNNLGRVYAAPFDVKLSLQDVVEPDLIFVSRARLQIIGPDAINGALDLVVEILSPSSRRRDQRQKADLYAQFGVPEYWQVDPERAEFAILVLRDGRYRPEPAVDGKVRSTVLPGLVIDVAALFAAL